MPTILDVVRVAGVPEMQGISLRPLWEEKSPAARVAFVESLEAENEEKAIQTDAYKYLVRIDAESVRVKGRAFIPADPAWRGLYDLRRDPGETVNLLEGDPDAAVKRQAAELDRELREHVAAQHPDSTPTTLDSEMVDRLRALGYVR
jgi:arylsulfatase A-like enzyme